MVIPLMSPKAMRNAAERPHWYPVLKLLALLDIVFQTISGREELEEKVTLVFWNTIFIYTEESKDGVDQNCGSD